MVSLFSLWLPILLSAVFMFIVSSIIHMMLPYHKSDWKKLPSQDDIMEDLRKYSIPPGDYFIPHCDNMEQSKSPEAKERFEKGPVALMTVISNGQPKMGKSLFQWFIYGIIVSIFAGYVARITLGPGADYMVVFRITSVVAFVGYSLALLQNSIWYSRSCSATVKSMFDGLIYALVTGGVFGWLWPSV